MSAQPPWIWKVDGFQVLTGVWKEKINPPPPVPCGQIPEYGPAHCLTIVMFGIHSDILMIALKEQQTNFKNVFSFFYWVCTYTVQYLKYNSVCFIP